MRHKVAGRKLGRNPSHRRSLLWNLVSSLLEHERIVTKLPKS
jgi:large subunit ribosomal protein L17